MTITELRYDSKQGIYIKVYSHIRGVNKPLSDCFSLNIKLTKKKQIQASLGRHAHTKAYITKFEQPSGLLLVRIHSCTVENSIQWKPSSTV